MFTGTDGRDDLYVILEVGRSASVADIKKSFRRLARRFHPDVNPGDRRAEERFKRISEAYVVLSHPDKRHFYDKNGFYSEEGDVWNSPSTAWGFTFQGFDFFQRSPAFGFRNIRCGIFRCTGARLCGTRCGSGISDFHFLCGVHRRTDNPNQYPTLSPMSFLYWPVGTAAAARDGMRVLWWRRKDVSHQGALADRGALYGMSRHGASSEALR
jgi:hypothetical protein